MWLALLVLGLVFTHGVNRESPFAHIAGAAATADTPGHFPPAATVERAATAAPLAPRPAAVPFGAHAGLSAHSDGSAHPAERCMPGQPQLNSGTAGPGSGPPPPGAVTARTTRAVAGDSIDDRAAAPRCAPVTGILRI
ncbi:hypothetical protein STSU_032825 [Streptomyces tsukubensis NRRL18488]|uniref:Uncharacterized protein n=1 Tax=Streptomyces tsukubensis (strain DSM 42081 / NBRC 108919 / NRRL 18488 / 9993) TaxID=1114943 RepID=I2MTG2_STRT9|nr:hypothetical protein [Streptomyces tsukubensis NRRL18488]QKM71188.1 hypothetical protein STSU_032825 [Streptomyces tsukubensis NRRL18488]